MNRDYWTIYDDDSREFEQELVQEERTNERLDSLLRQLIRKQGVTEKPRQEHFDDDLFEV